MKDQILVHLLTANFIRYGNVLICVDTQKSRYVSFGHTITERPTLDSRKHARCSVRMFNFNFTRVLVSKTGNRFWFIQVNETCVKFRQSSNFEFYEGNKTNQNVIQPILGFKFIFIQIVPLATEPGISLTLRRLMSYIYIYGAPILDVSISHTTTQHSR